LAKIYGVAANLEKERVSELMGINKMKRIAHRPRKNSSDES